jgi:hypothetical protein
VALKFFQEADAFCGIRLMANFQVVKLRSALDGIYLD